MRKRKQKIPNARCMICRKEFYVALYFLKHGWGKYCSKKCKDDGQKTGKFIVCSYCGKKIYRTPANLNRRSKTKTYFCNKSCQCAWKNKKRKGRNKINFLKRLWGSWCNSSIKVCGTFGADANSVDPPKRPSKKVVYDLYWKNNHTQTEIAKILGVTHEQLFSSKNLMAKDGHKCDSVSEIIIDDWLFENNISHFRERLYPKGKYSCDFIVDNIFIEFFGLATALDIHPRYREIMEKKKMMCKQYDIQLIELYEKDIYNLDQSLGKKLGLKLKQGSLF